MVVIVVVVVGERERVREIDLGWLRGCLLIIRTCFLEVIVDRW